MLLNFEDRPSDSPFVERIWRPRRERAGTFSSIPKNDDLPLEDSGKGNRRIDQRKRQQDINGPGQRGVAKIALDCRSK